jgi:hypothetical protein
MLREAVVVCIKVLCRLLPGGTEGEHKISIENRLLGRESIPVLPECEVGVRQLAILFQF